MRGHVLQEMQVNLGYMKVQAEENARDTQGRAAPTPKEGR